MGGGTFWVGGGLIEISSKFASSDIYQKVL